MSCGTRIYNIFNQIQNSKKGTTPLEWCMDAFQCKTIDDLFYLKPYIYGEIEFWKNDKISGGLSVSEVNTLINPLINFLNNQIFTVRALNYSSKDSSKDAIPKIIYFHSGQIQNAEGDITQIQTEVEELRQGIIANKKIKQGDDYVRNFILQNLDRIDLLLNNYDKIRPHYIELNISSITYNIVYNYPDCIKYLANIMVSAKNLLGDGLLLMEGYDKCIKPLIT